MPDDLTLEMLEEGERLLRERDEAERLAREEPDEPEHREKAVTAQLDLEYWASDHARVLLAAARRELERERANA